MQFTLREHVLPWNMPPQLQPGHPRIHLKPNKQCWGKQLQLHTFCQRSEWWGEMKQAACPGKGKIQKGPYFLKSWSLANPLLPQRSILCQPTALLCSDPAKRREGERFRQDSKEESSPGPGARARDRNANSKTRPSGNFCKKTVYTDSPFPPLPTPAVGLHSFSSKCNLLHCHCTPAAETATAFTRRGLFELQSRLQRV